MDIGLYETICIYKFMDMGIRREVLQICFGMQLSITNKKLDTTKFCQRI